MNHIHIITIDLGWFGVSLAALFIAWLLKSRPILDLWVNLGFLQISTEIMNRRDDMDVIRYVHLRFTIMGKYGFNIGLYQLGRYRYTR